MLAMVLNPAVYGKLQEEIDRVVGKDRLPDFTDIDYLPFLESVIKETYRYATI